MFFLIRLNDRIFVSLAKDNGCEGIRACIPFAQPLSFAREGTQRRTKQGKGHKRDTSYLCPFFCCEEIKAFLIPSTEGTQLAFIPCKGRDTKEILAIIFCCAKGKGHNMLLSLQGILALFLLVFFGSIFSFKRKQILLKFWILKA